METSILIGATAQVQLPELCINHLHARVDTGAATCALHASSIHIDEAKKEIRVILFDEESDLYTGEEFVFSKFVVRNVRNSFGRIKARPMIETEIVLAGRKEKVLAGFSNRSKLTYDMLIGRNLLQLGFLVDVTK
jgi:hypothetical protein